MKKILLLLISLCATASLADEIVVEGIRDKLKKEMLACPGMKPLNERSVSPRIPEGEYTKEEAERIFRFASTHSREIAQCIANFEDEYRKKVFDHCKENGLGNCIGGGCEHISAMIHAGVTVQGIGKCIALSSK